MSFLRQREEKRRASNARIVRQYKKELIFEDSFKRSTTEAGNNWKSVMDSSYFDGRNWFPEQNTLILPIVPSLEMYADGRSPGTSIWESRCWRNIENYAYPQEFEINLNFFTYSGAGTDPFFGISVYGTDQKESGLGIIWYFRTGEIQFVIGKTAFKKFYTPLIAYQTQKYEIKLSVSKRKINLEICSQIVSKELNYTARDASKYQLLSAVCPIVYNAGNNLIIRGFCRSSAYGLQYQYISDFKVYRIISKL